MSDFLAAEGMVVLDGYRPEHVEGAIDLVVVGNAISRGNPELEAALDRNLRYASLPEVVRDEWLWDAQSIVIAGTHGKTTTTALTGWLLASGGADPTVLAGGIARNFGPNGSSYRIGRGAAFVIEGDEYDSAYFDKTAKFLKYLPDVAVIANIEFDHADIYPDLDAVRLAFRRLVNLVPRRGLTLIGADSPEAAALAPLAQSRVQTFGLAEGAEWQAAGIQHASGVTTFRVLRAATDLGLFSMSLAGAHNVRNALAAIAVAVDSGLAVDAVREGLRTFAGVKRRLEVVGEARGVTIVDDFAHHPTAVAETLKAARHAWPGRRLWAVFEPRSASSCRRVFQADFAGAFDAADEVVVAAVFRSSLPKGERLSETELVSDLASRGLRARHLSAVDDIVQTLAEECRAGDVVIAMSNGEFGGIHGRLKAALEAKVSARS
jgi:UDP-N-acetylmuramate: L-alanyl-gamma-D-glutamyl-meso-diaminopimelate ligase